MFKNANDISNQKFITTNKKKINAGNAGLSKNLENLNYKQATIKITIFESKQNPLNQNFRPAISAMKILKMGV